MATRRHIAKRSGSAPLSALAFAAALLAVAAPDVRADGDRALPLHRVGRGGWVRDLDLPREDAAYLTPSDRDVSLPPPEVRTGPDGAPELVFEAAFPAPAGIVRRVKSDRADWGRGRRVRARIFVPAEAGAHSTAQLIAYHRIWGWFACEPTRPLRAGEWTLVSWPLDGDAPDWVPLGAEIAWNDTLRHRLDRVGLRVFSAARAACEVRVSDISIVGLDESAPPLEITRLTRLASEPAVGRRFEMSFDLSRWYDNPYNPDEISVDVVFTAPSGDELTLPAFYFQDYSRRRKSDGTEACDPRGRAEWRVRYTPREPGVHSYRFAARDASGDEYAGSPGAFEVADAPFRGYVRVDPRDFRYLSFTDGSFFYPLGLIVRSDWDERRQYEYEFDMQRDMGTYSFDDYFTSMSAVGINFARVWMSAWWTALEWSTGYGTDYPGLGRYNQKNAWRMDHFVDLAEKLGIYLDVTFHNHGQFRASNFDSEWYDNPYYAGNGGPVERPEEFWTDETCHEYLRRRLRYIVARWSASPSIGFWELCNEIDLVGDYNSSDIVAWHREMGRYLKAIDPYEHIVTTHYTSSRLDPNVLAMPEIEVAQTTSYNMDMIARLNHLFLDRVVYLKPVYINEFGVGRSHHELSHNLHSGLWSSSMMPLCGAALFWWWPYVHEMDQYYQYERVARFHAGEDYRHRDFQLTHISTTDQTQPLEAVGMQSTRAARLWVYDHYLYRGASRGREAAKFQPAEFRLDGLDPGDYRLEFWDTWKGGVVETRRQSHVAGPFFFRTPVFERDLAVKIDYVLPGLAVPGAENGASRETADVAGAVAGDDAGERTERGSKGAR